MKKNDANYIGYADILRILAAFSVVLLHVSGLRLVSVPIGSFEFYWAAFFDVATRWSVPLFVMLSGMLFLDEDKKLDIKKLYKKNILRLVTAFLFWSFIYNLHSAVIYGEDIKEAVVTALKNTPFGAMHLWFVFIMVGLYIVLPFVKRMCESITKRETECFILLGLIVTFLPKTLSCFDMFSKFTSYINKFEINFAAGYVSLFVAGWYIANFEHSRKFRVLSYMAGFIGFVYMYITTVHFSVVRGAIADGFMSFKSISAFLMAFAVMMCAKATYSKISFKKGTKQVLQALSSVTFGVYLVHELIVSVLKLNLLGAYPYFAMPLNAIIVFIISMLIVAVIRILPFGKYIS